MVMVMVTILDTKAGITVTVLMVMVMLGVVLLEIGVLMMKCDDVTDDKGGVPKVVTGAEGDGGTCEVLMGVVAGDGADTSDDVVGMAKVIMVTRNNRGVDGGSEHDGSVGDRRRW